MTVIHGEYSATDVQYPAEHLQLLNDDSQEIKDIRTQFDRLKRDDGEKTVNPFSRHFWQARTELKACEKKIAAIFNKDKLLDTQTALNLNRELDVIGRQFEGGFGGALLDSAQRIQANLMAQSTVKKVKGIGVKGKIQSTLNDFIRMEQTDLIRKNEAFQTLSARCSNIRKIFNIGAPILLVAAIAAAPFSLPLSAAFGIALLILIGARTIADIFIQENLVEKNLEIEAITKRIAEYSKLKTLTEKPAFNDFIKSIPAIEVRIPAPNLALQIARIFKLEQEYDALADNDRLKVHKLKECNKLRARIGLPAL